MKVFAAWHLCGSDAVGREYEGREGDKVTKKLCIFIVNYLEIKGTFDNTNPSIDIFQQNKYPKALYTVLKSVVEKFKDSVVRGRRI